MFYLLFPLLIVVPISASQKNGREQAVYKLNLPYDLHSSTKNEIMAIEPLMQGARQVLDWQNHTIMQKGINALSGIFVPEQKVANALTMLCSRFVALNRHYPEIALGLNHSSIPTNLVDTLKEYSTLGDVLFEAIFREFTPIAEHTVQSLYDRQTIDQGRLYRNRLLCGMKGLEIAYKVGGSVAKTDMRNCLNKIKFLIEFVPANDKQRVKKELGRVTDLVTSQDDLLSL